MSYIDLPHKDEEQSLILELIQTLEKNILNLENTRKRRPLTTAEAASLTLAERCVFDAKSFLHVATTPKQQKEQ